MDGRAMRQRAMTQQVHYNRDWELRSAVLGTTRMQGSHTAEKNAESLIETKQKWNLPDKCVATTDNAANKRKAFDLLNWKRFGCYGHRINLVLKNAMGIPEMARILGKSRKLVTLFHTSTSVNDVFMTKQKLLLPAELHGHKLLADVLTRWNSTLLMLERIIEQLPALMAVATDDTVSKTARTTTQNNLLSFDETSLAKAVVALLRPFKSGTEAVCSETNPTINKVLPVVTKLMRGLEENDEDLPAIKELKKKMKEQMMKRTESEDSALLGSILNPFTKGFKHMPATKARAEELLFNAASDYQVHIHVKQKKDEGNVVEPDASFPEMPVAPPDLPNTDIQTARPIPENQPEENSEELEEQPNRKKIKSADTDEWLSDVMCVGESRLESVDLVQDEVRRYLCVVLRPEDVKMLRSQFLNGGRKTKSFSPRMASVAKRVLCVQGSSVPSERVFSLAGQLVSKKRSLFF